MFRNAALIILLLLSHCTQEARGQTGAGEIISALERQADSLANEGHFEEAMRLTRRALNIYQADSQANPSNIVRLHRLLAYYARRAGNFNLSRTYLRTAIQFAEDHLPEGSEERVRTYNAMAILDLVLGHYSSAKKWFQKALEISSKYFPALAAQHFNNLGIAYEKIADYDSAELCYTQSLNFNKLHFGFWTEQVSNNYFNLGTLSYGTGQIDLAIAYFDSTLMILDSLLPPDHIDIAALYNNLGTTYQRKGDLRKAQEYLNKALYITEKFYGPDHPEVAFALFNLAIVYLEKGNWERAYTFLSRAHDIRIAAFGETHPLVAKTKNYLGRVLLERGEFFEAYELLMESQKIYSRLIDADPSNIAQNLSDIGEYFEKLNNFDEALKYHRRALELLRKRKAVDPADEAELLRKIGTLYIRNGNYIRARKTLEISLEKFKSVFGEFHPQIAETYAQMALAWPTDMEKSLHYCKQAFSALEYGKNYQNDRDYPNAPLALLRVYDAELNILTKIALEYDNGQYWERARKEAMAAVALMDRIRYELDEFSSKRILLDNFFPLYEKSLFIFYKSYEKENDPQFISTAFDIAEKSNAVLLTEAIHAAAASRFSGIPDTLIEKERQLRIKINYLEKQLLTAIQGPSPQTARKTEEIKHQLFTLKRQLQELSSMMRMQFPSYFRLRYASPENMLPEVRQFLDRQQTLISYFVGESNMFIFCVSPSEIHMLHLEKNFPLEVWIEDFIKTIRQFNPGGGDVSYQNQKYVFLAQELYNALIQPVESFIKGQRLIIIPGGVLGYLPFEALISEMPESFSDYGKLKFLIHQYEIGYTYATSLLLEKEKERRSRLRPLLVAPSFHGDTISLRRQAMNMVLKQLLYNKEEVQKIHRIIGGKLLLDSMATKDNFLNYASAANIIHLATHGKANDENGAYSYLAFYQRNNGSESELLFVSDLYNMQLNAELAVLSACETGVGEYQRGEGIVSLARGFFYAGVKSLVTTLWNIDDRATAQIMESFYREIAAGSSKSGALRRAKLEYLRANQHSYRAHPLFWAAFIPVGDMNPIDVNAGPIWPWLIGAALIMLPFLGWFYMAMKTETADS